MRWLFILTQVPQSAHLKTALSLMRAALDAKERIDAVYLTGEAASLASGHYVLGSPEMQLEEKLYRLSVEGEFPILACGRAVRALGIPVDHLSKGMILSGYADLARALEECDEVVEL